MYKWKDAGDIRCMICGAQADYPFRALTVRTLKVRDLGGEKKVQALGDFTDFGICSSCAEKELSSVRDFRAAIRPKLIRFGAVLLAGIILILVFFNRDRVFLLLGCAAMLCGILGIGSVVTDARKRRAEYEGYTADRAIREAAWEAVVKNAPKKNGDEDLSYIPVTPETLSMKNGDLMILYDLLPEIAVQAYTKIRAEYNNRNGAAGQ